MRDATIKRYELKQTIHAYRELADAARLLQVKARSPFEATIFGAAFDTHRLYAERAEQQLEELEGSTRLQLLSKTRDVRICDHGGFIAGLCDDSCFAEVHLCGCPVEYVDDHGAHQEGCAEIVEPFDTDEAYERAHGWK